METLFFWIQSQKGREYPQKSQVVQSCKAQGSFQAGNRNCLNASSPPETALLASPEMVQMRSRTFERPCSGSSKAIAPPSNLFEIAPKRPRILSHHRKVLIQNPPGQKVEFWLFRIIPKEVGEIHDFQLIPIFSGIFTFFVSRFFFATPIPHRDRKLGR